MEIKKIIDYVNRSFIASDRLRAPDIYYYMDLVIDDINERLQANFPAVSDWVQFTESWNKWIEHVEDSPIRPMPHGHHLPPMDFDKPLFLRSNDNYDAFPDKYIRSVLALGTAVKFYTRDEEGEQIAMDYQNRYERALFNMVRDYHNQVPWFFQNNEGGFIDFSYNRERGPRDLVPRGVVMNGSNTRIL